MPAYTVVGLGLGEEGKGATVDFLCKEYGADVVVRYGGGPQSNHYVVRSDGTPFCFSQLGAGSFHSGVRTHLARGMIMKPQSLMSEISAIRKSGVLDSIERLSIDPKAAIVLPWHAMLSQILEVSRGSDRHGTVGVGVGIAAEDRAELGQSMLRFGDIHNRVVLREKLTFFYGRLFAQAKTILKSCYTPKASGIYNRFLSCATLEGVFAELVEIGQHLEGVGRSDEELLASNRKDATLVLEGTHGLLLSPQFGFSPHITKSDVGFEAAEAFLDRAGYSGKRARVGVLRAYATRHGTGPLVTFDSTMTAQLPEPHNCSTEWLESFRVGSFDLLLARYALACCKGVDFISLTNLDRLAERDSVSVCTAYEYLGSDKDALNQYFDCEEYRGHQVVRCIRAESVQAPEGVVARLLSSCRPYRSLEFEGWPKLASIRGDRDLPAELRRFIEFIESWDGLDTRVGIVSFGPRAEDKYLRAA